MLTSVHTFDPTAGCDATTFQPCSDKALANLKVYVDSFRSIYSINSGIASNAAVATGRYPEDSYYNGNPWYLATFAVAEQLYDALITWSSQGSLTVTSTSLPFFQQFSSSLTTGTYASTTSTYQTLTSAIKTFADGFVAINAQYTPSNGGLSEQYSKSNGAPTSAVDLTWSYASALTVFSARSGFSSPSWGAKGLTVPTTCSGNSGGGSGGTVAVTFNVQATTVYGGKRQIFYSVVNEFLMGLQKIFTSPDLWTLYRIGPLMTHSSSHQLTTQHGAVCSFFFQRDLFFFPLNISVVTVNLPASTQVQYKYIRKYNGAVTWESDPNDQITTPSGGSFTQNDSWR